MEEKRTFQSELTYDLPKYREFTELNTHASIRTTFFSCLVIVCMFYLILGLDNLFTARLVLGLSIFYGVMALVRRFRDRKGGTAYKRLLKGNNGQVPQHCVSVDEGGIHILDRDSGKTISSSFRDARYLMESRNLLVIVDEVKLAHILDKSTLTGGTRDQLVAFLQKNCPKLKKQIRTGKAGLIAKKVLTAVIIAAALVSLAVVLKIPARLSGQFTNDMSYQQMAEELSELGIQISPDTIRDLMSYETDTPDPFDFLYDDYPKVMNLLSWEGMGIYDTETMNWTPSQSGVYWFDLEVMDASAIYTGFLTGIDAMDPALSFSQVTEDYSLADPESGTGKVLLSFAYLGKTHELSAQYNFDWFDTDMLYAVGRILAADDHPEDLWMSHDGGQGILLYYGTQEEMSALAKKTGLIFFDCVTMRMGH